MSLVCAEIELINAGDLELVRRHMLDIGEAKKNEYRNACRFRFVLHLYQ